MDQDRGDLVSWLCCNYDYLLIVAAEMRDVTLIVAAVPAGRRPRSRGPNCPAGA